MAINNDLSDMELVSSMNTGYNLYTQYIRKCNSDKHKEVDSRHFATQKESNNGINTTKAIFNCGCIIVSKLEPSIARGK